MSPSRVRDSIASHPPTPGRTCRECSEGPFAPATCDPLVPRDYILPSRSPVSLHRVFLPFTSDTLGGIGAEPFIQWLKGVYTANNLRLRAEGDDGSSGRLLLDDLLAEWLAVLMRDNVNMIERLTIRDAS